MKSDISERQSVETLEIRNEIEISAPITIAFEAMLDELGPEGQMLSSDRCSERRCGSADVRQGAERRRLQVPFWFCRQSSWPGLAILGHDPEKWVIASPSGQTQSVYPELMHKQQKIPLIGGELSQILPYRDPNITTAGRIGPPHGLKVRPWPLTVPVHSREIVNKLI